MVQLTREQRNFVAILSFVILFVSSFLIGFSYDIVRPWEVALRLNRNTVRLGEDPPRVYGDVPDNSGASFCTSGASCSVGLTQLQRPRRASWVSVAALPLPLPVLVAAAATAGAAALLLRRPLLHGLGPEVPDIPAYSRDHSFPRRCVVVGSAPGSASPHFAPLRRTASQLQARTKEGLQVSLDLSLQYSLKRDPQVRTTLAVAGAADACFKHRDGAHCDALRCAALAGAAAAVRALWGEL